MTLAQLFLNIAVHHELPIDFGESLESLYSLDFEDSGLALRDILNKRYPDGITGLESVEVDGNAITGIFLDQISPTVTKKFNFTINSDSGEVVYDQIDTEDLDFSEVDFAVKKSQSCTKGKSFGCTREDGTIYCLPLGRKCASAKLAPKEITTIKEIVEKAPKTPKVKATKTPKVVKDKLVKEPKPVKEKVVKPKAETETKTTVKPSKSKLTAVDDADEATKLLINLERSKSFKAAGLIRDIKRLEAFKDKFKGDIASKEKQIAKLKINFSADNSQVADSHTIMTGIMSDAQQIAAGRSIPRKVGIIKSPDGTVASAFTYSKKSDHVYLDLLATSPENLVDGKGTKGAGTEAIASLVEKSIELGFGGKVKLESLPGALTFYQKIGFTGKQDSMTLSPKAAKEFLKKVRG